MTSYMVDYLWRHINLKLHQLGYLYVTWPKSRDVISVRYHVMKLITPENPGNEVASFLKKRFVEFGRIFFQEWRLLISRLLDFSKIRW